MINRFFVIAYQLNKNSYNPYLSSIEEVDINRISKKSV